MVFPRKALASGPGKAPNSNAPTPTWRKVKRGKESFQKMQGAFPQRTAKRILQIELFWVGVGVQYFHGFKSRPGGVKWLFLWNP
jgi:hypothetical protein